MQTLQVGDYPVSYQKVGTGPLLVLLHGWANTWEAWLPVVPLLADHFTLIIPDLPSFGKSLGPEDGWSTRQYALWLSSFLKKILKQFPHRRLYLAGHSYGGKISTYYCSQDFAPHPDKLVLIDASGIPGKLSRKQTVLKLMSLATPPFLKHTLSETVRRRLYRSFDADSDYLNANEAQRHTLKKILPENLTPELYKVEQPTLILWGKADPATPLSAGQKFHTLIAGSQFQSFEAEHFPHHQHPEKVAEAIITFLKAKAPPITAKLNGRWEAAPSHTMQSLTTILAILQQAEYEWPRLIDWVSSQTGVVEIEPKKWTGKLRTLERLTLLSQPLFGRLGALFIWNGLLSIPQAIFFRVVVLLAIVKLRLLQFSGLTVVAVAGSYAKTSTKYIMEHCFTTSLSTLMTPENINTPYGIARVILRDLKLNNQLFIAELGEYYPGDIRKLTRFLRPKFKVLTPVGYAHLERFRTQERLEQGLLELLTTPPFVPAFVHSLNAPLIEKYDLGVPKIYLYGPENINEASVTRAGTEFTVELPEKNRLFIPLLGTHNAVNTLPTLMLANLIKADLKTVVGRLRTLPHIPHRLEPTLLTQNVFLIDNGYNSNPGSARESLAVLDEVEGSQKIVITPGFVEMGEEQESANLELGEELAEICDYVGLVTGTNEAAIMTGLAKAGFNMKHVLEGTSELEIMNTLQPKIKPNAVILFENSLTDIYKTV